MNSSNGNLVSALGCLHSSNISTSLALDVINTAIGGLNDADLEINLQNVVHRISPNLTGRKLYLPHVRKRIFNVISKKKSTIWTDT